MYIDELIQIIQIATWLNKYQIFYVLFYSRKKLTYKQKQNKQNIKEIQISKTNKQTVRQNLK